MEEVLDVIVQNTETDAENCRSFGKLYLACKDLFSDNLIRLILSKGGMNALPFHTLVREQRQVMVQVCMEANCVSMAVDLLDSSCDELTFTKVLLAPSTWMQEEVVEKMDIMKDLGYKREMALFERLITSFTFTERKDREKMIGIFREMVEEHPGVCAAETVYQKAFDNARKLTFAHYVCIEARSKGINLNLDKICDLEYGNWDKDAVLVHGIINNPPKAYEYMLSRCTSFGQLVYVVKDAIGKRFPLDATKKLIECFRPVFEQDMSYLLSEGLELNDATLAQGFTKNYYDCSMLFKLAARTPQPLPLSLNAMLQKPCSQKDALLCFRAFCNLVKPSKTTSKLMAKALLKQGMIGEVCCILNTHHCLKFKKNNEKNDALLKKFPFMSAHMKK